MGPSKGVRVRCTSTDADAGDAGGVGVPEVSDPAPRHAGGQRLGYFRARTCAGGNAMGRLRGMCFRGSVSTLGLGSLGGGGGGDLGAVVMFRGRGDLARWITGLSLLCCSVTLLLVAGTLRLPMITFRFYMANVPTYTQYENPPVAKPTRFRPIPKQTQQKTTPRHQAAPPPSANPTAPPPRTSPQKHRR